MIREIRRGIYPGRSLDAAKNLERFRRLMVQAQKANIKIPKQDIPSHFQFFVKIWLAYGQITRLFLSGIA